MIRLLSGDCRDVLPTLPAESVHTVVTSPPYYGLRDYGTALWDGGDANCQHEMQRGKAFESGNWRNGKDYSGSQKVLSRDCACGAVRVDRQIGLEPTPDEYLATMVAVFREIRRVLRRDGTCWVNMGDSYATQPAGNKDMANRRPFEGGAYRSNIGMDTTKHAKPKDLLLMPARLALALQADGWWVRSDIIWHKPNPMPESCKDRPTSAHEHVFMLTRSARYYYDADAVREASGESSGWAKERAGGGNTWDYGRDGYEQARIGGMSGKETFANTGSRNLRNVWTIATAPFSEWTPSHALVPVPASEVPAPGASKSAGGSGTARITSPDCPSHAGQPDSVPMGFYDGLSADQLSRIRDTDNRPAPDTHPGSSTIQHGSDRSRSLPSMRDCSDPLDAASATPHSTESHRTDLGHLFSEHAISSEEIGDGRPRTAPSQSSPALTDRDTGGSSSEADSSLSHCEPGTAADSSRTSALDGSSACRCGYYRKVTTKTSHFATFPPELAERCIKAGTSERGCCAACGKPWVRVTETTRTKDPTRHTGRAAVGCGDRMDADWPRMVTDTTTTGWAPGCDHEAACVPCTVLDPFIGAGTTALVADRLQRDAIGIDLNTQYTRMAMDRCIADAPLLADLGPMPEHPEESALADLFTDMAAD